MKSKVVIITGASSGIGEACADLFAGKGANVILAARNSEKLELIAEKLKERGGKVFAVKTDVSNEEDCKFLINEVINTFNRIDVLINNAGISMRALFADTDLSVIRKLMDTNFWGTVYCTKYALPYLIESKGSVVGISSIAGFKGLPGRVGYSASKFAMQGFLECLRIENLKNGLHVLTVAPGFTNTNIRNVALSNDGSIQKETPLDESKLMSSETVAKNILNGIKNRKREIVLTSQGKLTVLLNKWFPGWMDKMVFDHFAKEKDSPLK
ncbi:SDR family oxidoreductase [Bacteroidales bacterium AH-315-N07]|nr:SDR family oxidoreductase [Bacteroidales bacterium AH-315-N07]